ncbi:MAG TPA: siderophore-interacting protein [Gryllotalpicola sp.]
MSDAHTVARRERLAALPPLRWYDTVVAAVRDVTPHMVRVTLTGEELRSFVSVGPDEHFKLVLPRGGDGVPAFDMRGDLFAQWRALPDDIRPYLRTYTVRALRPESAELDVDIAIHDLDTPVMRWVAQLAPGDRCAVYAGRGEFAPPAEASWLLLIADDAGLPALNAILASLPSGTVAHAFAEVAGPADEQGLELGTGATLTWVHRAPAEPGSPGALMGALASATFPAGAPYIWAAAEMGVVKAIRAHLADRGYSTTGSDLVGYWRTDGPTDPN